MKHKWFHTALKGTENMSSWSLNTHTTSQTSRGPSEASGEEKWASRENSSGNFQTLATQSSPPLTKRLEWNGEKAKSVTKPECPLTTGNCWKRPWLLKGSTAKPPTPTQYQASLSTANRTQWNVQLHLESWTKAMKSSLAAMWLPFPFKSEPTWRSFTQNWKEILYEKTTPWGVRTHTHSLLSCRHDWRHSYTWKS